MPEVLLFFVEFIEIYQNIEKINGVDCVVLIGEICRAPLNIRTEVSYEF